MPSKRFHRAKLSFQEGIWLSRTELLLPGLWFIFFAKITRARLLRRPRLQGAFKSVFTGQNSAVRAPLTFQNRTAFSWPFIIFLANIARINLLPRPSFVLGRVTVLKLRARLRTPLLEHRSSPKIFLQGPMERLVGAWIPTSIGFGLVAWFSLRVREVLGSIPRTVLLPLCSN